HAGLVAHHREGGEDRAAHQVAQDDDRDGLPEAELEDDAEGAEGPVDRGDVGARPDPHLLRAGGVLVGLGNGFDAVNVGPELASGFARHVAPLDPSPPERVWVMLWARTTPSRPPRYCAAGSTLSRCGCGRFGAGPPCRSGPDLARSAPPTACDAI